MIDIPSWTFLTLKSFDNSEKKVLQNSFKCLCHMLIMIGFHMLHEKARPIIGWNCRGFRRDSEMLEILEIMHYIGQALLF